MTIYRVRYDDHYLGTCLTYFESREEAAGWVDRATKKKEIGREVFVDLIDVPLTRNGIVNWLNQNVYRATVGGRKREN